MLTVYACARVGCGVLEHGTTHGTEEVYRARRGRKGNKRTATTVYQIPTETKPGAHLPKRCRGRHELHNGDALNSIKSVSLLLRCRRAGPGQLPLSQNNAESNKPPTPYARRSEHATKRGPSVTGSSSCHHVCGTRNLVTATTRNTANKQRENSAPWVRRWRYCHPP